MSTVELRRDQAHASPSGRFVAPLTACLQLEPAQVAQAALVDGVEHQPARLRVIRRRHRLHRDAELGRLVQHRPGRPGRIHIARARPGAARPARPAAPATQPVPGLRSTTSICGRPSARDPQARTEVIDRSGVVSNASTTGSSIRAPSAAGSSASASHFSSGITCDPDPSTGGQSPTPSRSTAKPARVELARLGLQVVLGDPDPERRVRLRPHLRIQRRLLVDLVRACPRPATTRNTPAGHGRRSTPAHAPARTRPRPPAPSGRPPSPCTRAADQAAPTPPAGSSSCSPPG